MKVEAVQFLRPDGEQKIVYAEVADDLADNYATMRETCKCRITIELNPGDVVSICIEHEEGDFDIELVPNGPGVQVATDRIIRRFNKKNFDRWLAGIKAEA